MRRYVHLRSAFYSYMLDLKSFGQAVQQIADEKGIPKEKILETIETALAAAYKRDYGQRGQIVRAKMDTASGKVEMKQIKIVVDESMLKAEEEEGATTEGQEGTDASAKEDGGEHKEKKDEAPKEEEESPMDGEEAVRVRFNPERHLMLDEARAIKKDVEPGDELEFPLEYHEEYGRIAAQTAKQVIIQRIREVEREAIFEEFQERKGEIVSGLVQRIEGRNMFVDIGRTVGVLPPEEQIPRESYRIGQRIKALIVTVERHTRGSGIFLSRAHPMFLQKLFEIEVPEIAAGTVEIRSIAREPGSRSKVAVISHEDGVDPVGSLVGQKGIRVSTVIGELGGEKIDIIEWSNDTATFIANALSPAKIIDVDMNDERGEAKVMVAEDNLSLAIGKGGQNVRLAAKLTGRRIDVRAAPVQQKAEEAEQTDEESPSEETESTDNAEHTETSPVSE